MGGDSERSGANARLPRATRWPPFRLIFASAPYAGHFVPDGVRVMSAAAFARGCPPPRKAIDVPDSLERVDLLDEPRDALAGQRSVRLRALSRAVRSCHRFSVEKNQCWYGFAEGNDPAEKNGFAREDGVAKEPSVAAEGGSLRPSQAALRPPIPPRASSRRRPMPA